jgi:membrane protein DedA with SNARE-associated domain
LNAKIAASVLGSVLIVVALIAGGLQISDVYKLSGNPAHTPYFYAGVGVIGAIGVILAAWSLLRKETPKQTSPKDT